MMRLTIGNDVYTAETAVGLIEQVKALHWHAGSAASAEDYISIQEATYRKLTGRRLKLHRRDTETRAREMFRKIAETGAWIFEEGGNGDE